MNRNSFFIALMLILATASFGQETKKTEPVKSAAPVVKTAKEQLADLNKEAAPLLAQRADNKKALEALTKTKDDIEFGDATLTKYTAKFKTDKTAYDLDLAAYAPAANEINAQLNAHNANQCRKTQSDDCAAYEAEATRLNARRDYLQTVKNDLDSRKGFLDTTLGQLRELAKVMEAKEEKYVADAKAFNTQNAENEAKIAAIGAKWTKVLESMGDCFKKLPDNATDEQVHEACGAAWDGNAVGKKPLVNQGTGGVTPNGGKP